MHLRFIKNLTERLDEIHKAANLYGSSLCTIDSKAGSPPIYSSIYHLCEFFTEVKFFDFLKIPQFFELVHFFEALVGVILQDCGYRLILKTNKNSGGKASIPFGGKLAYYNLLGQMAEFLKTHGLYPQKLPMMKQLAPELDAGYVDFVKKSSNSKIHEHFKRLVTEAKDQPGKLLASDIKYAHMTIKTFNRKDIQPSVLYWFLVLYQLDLLNGPVRENKVKPLFKAGSFTGARTAEGDQEKWLDTVHTITPAGVQSKVTNTSAFLLQDDEESLLTIPQRGIMLFQNLDTRGGDNIKLLHQRSVRWMKKK